jgi:ADP-ribose pyrophosphatase YjhB (NUDIX family)
MITTQQIALWADQLRDVAAQGMHWSNSRYDVDRYRAIQTIAMTIPKGGYALLAAVTMDGFAATGEPVEALEPLRATVFSHVTPFAVGDAAVIDDAGRILLVQRADNAQWALPGGALEVGETPAQGVVREALEETGVASEAVALVGVFDSRLCGTLSRHQLYQFVFLCRPLAGRPPGPASHAHEVLGTGWFAEDALPADIDPGHVTRIPVAFRAWHTRTDTPPKEGDWVGPYFDP